MQLQQTMGSAGGVQGKRSLHHDERVDPADADQHRPTAAGRPRTAEVLRTYCLLTYLALLLNTGGYLGHVVYNHVWESLFAVAVYFTYSAFYLLPVVIVVSILYRVLTLSFVRKRFAGREAMGRWIVYAMAIAGFTFIQYLVFADKSVFSIFGFHLNGFVWNLLLTKGGIDSMGGGSSTTVLAILVGVAFVVAQTLLLVLVLKVQSVPRFLARFFTRRAVTIGVCSTLFVTTAAEIGYGVSSLRNYGPVLAAADAFPCFIPTTFSKLATSMGYKVKRVPTMAGATDSVGLNYPLNPMEYDNAVKPPNIVWLVSESLRADMLNQEIMPATWELSQRSSRFEHHYSGGNGTRMGMFSMFYGLYGPYWFSFLGDSRGPVLVDRLIDLNYEMEMYTSAMFSYPEFDKTLFSRLPSDRLHQGGGKPAWRQDQRHIDSMLRFLEHRDTSRPFFTFMFFESPHANYSFSKSAIIRRPYAEQINYVSMNLERDIGLMKNRYINASRQVDIEVRRVLDFLTKNELMDSTIVIVTGDHGEEFMEKGRWGHNSEFTEEQTVVPMVIWVPGKPARVVTRITSHLDIPATIMPLLGAINPSDDYSLGYDLFGPDARPFTVISSWNHVAYVDDQFKATFPTSAHAMFQQSVTTTNDDPVEDRMAFYEKNQGRIVELMLGLKAFRR